MNTYDEEPEIKIEYIESYENDPLCENRRKNNDSFQIKTHENNKADIDTNFNDIKTSVHDENNYSIEKETDTHWYKEVDNFGKYICQYCNLTYLTVQTLRNHIRKKHIQNYYLLKKITNCPRKKQLKCHICNENAENMTNLQQHVDRHNLKDIQNTCSICHATFEDSTDMLAHITREHKSKDFDITKVHKSLYICFICGYRTRKLANFKQHENTHTQKNTKQCSYCTYSTNHLPNMKVHERIHTKEKPYKCEFVGCDYRCTSKSGLNSHMLKHDKTKLIYYCDKCSYSTVYKNTLKKHIDSHKRNTLRKRV